MALITGWQKVQNPLSAGIHEEIGLFEVQF